MMGWEDRGQMVDVSDLFIITLDRTKMYVCGTKGEGREGKRVGGGGHGLSGRRRALSLFVVGVIGGFEGGWEGGGGGDKRSKSVLLPLLLLLGLARLAIRIC